MSYPTLARRFFAAIPGAENTFGAPASVVISPSSLVLGNSTPQVLTAIVKDSSGRRVRSGFTTDWASSNATHIPVTVQSFNTATVAGNLASQSATITVTVHSTAITGTASVTTSASVISSVTISPSSDTLTSGSPTVTGTATSFDQFGSVVP